MHDANHQNVKHFEGDGRVPKFFRRVWNPSNAGQTEVHGNVAFITMDVPDGGLVIYGYSYRSPYEEDNRYEVSAFIDHEEFPAMNFSVAAPSGEYGGVPLAEVQEITEAEFDAARDRGFVDHRVRRTEMPDA
jgi:hypothetical protein